jgi:NADH-quinone oxidoreductase subunit M
MPLFGALSLIVTLSSMGLPGLNGFVGEFTILMGSLGSQTLGFYFTLFATLGVILAAVYMLYMFQKVYLGEPSPMMAGTEGGHGHDAHGHDDSHSSDPYLHRLHWIELAVIVPIIVLCIWIGVQPRPFFATMDASVNQVVEQVNSGTLQVADKSVEP